MKFRIMIRLVIISLPLFCLVNCFKDADKFNSIFEVILSDKLISESDLSNYMKSSDLRIIRNSVYAKYGYLFKSDDLKEFFSKVSWYKGKLQNVDNLLTQNDKINVKLISYKESNAEIQEFLSLPSDNLPRDSSRIYFGFWHDSPVVASGWGNTLSFFPNGKVIARFNTMDCGKRLLAYIGSWQVEKDNLSITYTFKEHVEGGEFVQAYGSCASDKELVNGQVKVSKINPPMQIEYKVSSVPIDRYYYNPQDLPLFQFGNARYWKLNDDPNYY
ncbi:YARHG domain-containing protein [Leptospira sp. B5-022]|uniref:YARHG domain-containing protein n=1 Tax=Leptospira sp. B5-022 TaxID=1242992 RepID=UPI0002BD88DC|nr:YARHG domain-containing protein [Leptospira sp. B5-022]EMJ97705.1 YARHG domain protein [Leptospira sp. B5-022]